MHNVVLVSAYRKVSRLRIYCFIIFSIMVYHRILNIIPCAIQSDIVVYSYYSYPSLHLLIPNQQTFHSLSSYSLATRNLFLASVSCSCFIDMFICVIFQVPHTSDSIWYLSFSFRLTLPSMIISRSRRWYFLNCICLQEILGKHD